MSIKDKSPEDKALLRQQAEAIALDKFSGPPERNPSDIHELRVHQIELELQNEELRRTQVELDALRSRYFDLYDLAPVGYATVGANGAVQEINLTAATLLGTPRSVFTQRLFYDFILNKDRDIHYWAQKKASDTGEAQEYELRMVRNDGTQFWAHLTISMALEEDGHIVYRIVMSNITERKRSEDALRESEARFRSMADSAPVLIWQSGTDALCDYFNQRWLDFTGRTLKQELGNGWTEGVHPDDYQKCQDIYLGAFNAQREFSMEYRLRHADGEYRWVLDIGSPRFTPDEVFLGYVGSCVDISKRKRAEEMQVEQGRRLEGIIEGTHVGTWEWNIQTGETIFNEVWAQIIGYTLDELGPVSIKTWETFVHPDDLTRSATLLEQHFRGDLPYYDCECRMKHKDGAWIWVHDRGRVITRTNDEQPLMMFGTHADITERKQAEENLLGLKLKIGTQEIYSVLVEKAAEGFWLLDKDFTTTYVNPAIEKMLGYSSGEMIGRSWYAFGDAEWVVRAKELERRREDGVSEPHQFLFISKTGEKVMTRIATTPLYAEDGSFDGALGVVSDITRQKEAQDALEVKDLLNSVAKSAGIGMSIINPDYTIVWYNDSFVEWFGPLETTAGRTCFELFRQRDSICSDCPSKKVFETGEAASGEHVGAITTLGADRIFELTSTPVRDAIGKIIQVVEIARDITERKRNEDEKKKLEVRDHQLQKSESLGRMAGAVAHHFNNKLMGVMGNLELALEDLPAQTDCFEIVSNAMQAAHEASVLSSLMLTYLGKSFQEQMPLNLSTICRKNIPLIQSFLPKNVELESNLSNFRYLIRANDGEIQQLLVNTITNAAEAAEGAPCRIILTVKECLDSHIAEINRFPIDAQTNHTNYACLEVSDTGCGIPATDIQKLFDPFFSTKFTGRGMGLPTVFGITRSHDGIITVESKVGQGSIFRFYFPMLEEQIPQPTETAPKERGFSGHGTVLVVDDEEMLRKVTGSLVARFGFDVLTAKDGVEAVDVFLEHRREIRCVLCDLSMPRMDGWETLNALRKIVPDLPVILASGYNEETMMQGDHPELPQAYLTKPYRRDLLCEALQTALAGEEDDSEMPQGIPLQ